MLFHTRDSLLLRLIGVIGVAVQRKHERLQTPGLKPAVPLLSTGGSSGGSCVHMSEISNMQKIMVALHRIDHFHLDPVDLWGVQRHVIFGVKL